MQRGIFSAAFPALMAILWTTMGCPPPDPPVKTVEPPALPAIPIEKTTSAAETIQILRGHTLALLPGGAEPPTWEEQYGRDYVPILDLAEGSGGDVYACTGTHGLVHLTSSADGNLTPKSAHFPAHLQTTKPGYGRCEHVATRGNDVFSAHRGDWFAPQSHLVHRRQTGSGLVDVAVVPLQTSVEDIVASGNTLYAAMHGDGIQRFTITDEGLQSERLIEGLTNAWGLAVHGDRLLVADGRGGLARIVTHPNDEPRVEDRIALPGTALDVAVSVDGTRAYVALGAAGIAEVSLAKPMRLARRIQMEGSVVQLGIRGDTLVASAWSNVQLLSIPAGSSPKRTGIHAINNERGVSRTFATLQRETDILVGDWFGLHRIRFHPDIDAPVPPGEPAPASLVIGQPAPEVEGTLPDGSAWRLSEQRGKVVVLAYFGSFCPVCLLEFADLNATLWGESRHPDVRLVGLGIHETADRIAAFQRQSGAEFPLLIAKDQLNTGLLKHRQPGISQYPFEVVIDRSGRIASMSSRHTPSALTNLVDALLKAP
jgi:peroxiredoxin